MKIYLVEVQTVYGNMEYEENIEKVFKSYRTASDWLLSDGYEVK
jgi:hypothetical protein